MDTAGARLFDLLSKHPNYGPRGQSRLSRDSGVPQSTISRFIKDGNVPEMETIAKIAVVFEVTCEWLITGRGPKYVAETYVTPGKNDAPLSDSARKLVDAVVVADGMGVDSAAFEALREMLRLLSRPVAAQEEPASGRPRHH